MTTTLNSFRTSNCAPFYFIHYVLFTFVSAGGFAIKWVDRSFELGCPVFKPHPVVWLTWVTLYRLSSVFPANMGIERHIRLWPPPFLSFPLHYSQIIASVEQWSQPLSA